MKTIPDVACLDFYKLSKSLCKSLNKPTHYLPRVFMEKMLPGETQNELVHHFTHIFTQKFSLTALYKRALSHHPSFIIPITLLDFSYLTHALTSYLPAPRIKPHEFSDLFFLLAVALGPSMVPGTQQIFNKLLLNELMKE